MTDVNNQAVTDESDDEAANLFVQMSEAKDSKDSSASDSDEQSDTQGDDASEREGDDTTSNSQGQAEEDPWATVPEALRNEHLATKQRAQQFESQFNASQHRLVPTQRELEAARKRLAELEAQGGKNKGSGDMPTAADLKGKTFDELKEEWPEVAQALLDSQAHTQQLIQRELEPLKRKQEEREQKLQQEEDERLFQSEFARLSQMHPDAQEIALDPSFKQWLGNQPQSVQAMYGSVSADDNAALLTLFKTVTGRATKRAAAKSSLSDHVAIPRQGPGRAAVDPNSIDPVELFNRLSAHRK